MLLKKYNDTHPFTLILIWNYACKNMNLIVLLIEIFYYENNNELVIVIGVTLGYETHDWGCENDSIPLNLGERSIEMIEIVIL